MIRYADALDRTLITTVDGFCRHLQSQIGIPFGWMLSSISIGTGFLGATAAVLMFGDDEPIARVVVASLWSACLVFMATFFRRTLWLHMRKWPRERLTQHWTAMAMMARSDGKPIRLLALFGTSILTLSSLLQMAGGSTEFALETLRYLFVSMFPVTLMMYAFCALPASSGSTHP